MKRKVKGRNNPTLVNIEPLCLARAKPTSSKKMKMEKGSFHSIRTWKNPSSLLRYSQINGFAMSLQQKVNERFPKLLDVKNPMQKTEKGGPKGKNKMIKWAKPAQLLPKEIGSFFSNGSRNKKPFQSSKNDRNDNADALDDCTEERDALIASRKKGNKFRTLLEDSIEGLTLSRSGSFKKIMRIIGTKGKQRKKKDEATSETSTGTRKQPRILFPNLSGTKFRFRTRVRFRFNNWKTNKADTGTDFEGADCGAVKNAETGKMSKTISWASIQRPTGYCIIRSMKSIHKRMMKQGRKCKHEDGDEQEKVELELCKKRILMGDKCRPLSASGSLHYDQNGILLPEVLPYQEL
ncbi:hypothetical protein A4A49_08122 [Nicotiana attenuata]|uniref:Uncharacterized protein n=1 Tax=Nicotiana attenuata TaxID=49451 RepID=A0A1J6I4C4_NICAT|nr:hypothetical protein A4A49_08122 [Nicotiana attenuata]